MSTTDLDVVVVGAGMAGATAALALSHGGLRVGLVDRAPLSDQLDPRFDGRASAIAYASLRQWRVLGLAEALAPHASPIRHILVTDARTPGAAGGGQGHSAFLRFDAAEAGDPDEPLGWMIENRQIRRALAQGLARSGVTVMAPATVTGMSREGPAATLDLDDGRRLVAPLLVSAEGRVSALRDQAGIGVTGWPYGRSGVVATVALERPHQDIAHEHFLPGGPFAILPLTEQRASLVWTETTARAQALDQASDAAFGAHLQRRFGDYVGRVEVVGPRFVYPLGLQLAESLTAPRLALLGDAAHVIHPIAGQGLNLGLKDAAALAEVVVEAHRLGEDIGAETVLDRYARWRRFDTVTLGLATDLFDRLFSTDRAPVRAVRDLGMAVVNRIGPARRFFMREAGGEVGDLPRLMQGLPL